MTSIKMLVEHIHMLDNSQIACGFKSDWDGAESSLVVWYHIGTAKHQRTLS